MDFNIHHQRGPARTRLPLGLQHLAAESLQSPGQAGGPQAALGTPETRSSVIQCSHCLTAGPSPSPHRPPLADNLLIQ